MFVRERVNKKTGHVTRSLEERYREGDKVKSRYIRTLSPTQEHDRSVVGHAREFQDMEQGMRQLEAREQAKEAPDAKGEASKGESNGQGEQGGANDGGKGGEGK
jgi:hypothetical protein